MKERLLLSVGIVLLSGCAEVRYVKAGATQADFEADKVDCHNQVLMSPSGVALSRGAMGKPAAGQGMATQSARAMAQQDVKECLQSKGWTPETQSK